MRVGFELRAIGAHPYDATAVHGQLGAVGALRIDETEVADCNVDPAVDAHPDSIRGVVHAAGLVELAGTDLLYQMLGWTIRLAVAIGIGQHR